MVDEATLERRLAAVLASDVAGYSRLMQLDEARTLKALEIVNGIAKTQIELHRGRIANTAGDSIVAVFASAVDAVSCALIVQEVLIQIVTREQAVFHHLEDPVEGATELVVELQADGSDDGRGNESHVSSVCPPGRG